jgi:hypothetical protein
MPHTPGVSLSGIIWPPAKLSTAPPTRRSRLLSALARAGLVFAVVALASSRNVFRQPASLHDKCDPFAQPGALYLDVDEYEKTLWRPFDATCPPSHLLPAVQAILRNDAMYALGLAPRRNSDSRADSDPKLALPWLSNRTMCVAAHSCRLSLTSRRSVFIGDSVERFSVDYFCELVDGDLALIDKDHPWSPPGYRNGRDELQENEETVRTWQADGRPHWCSVDHQGLNLNLISFFMCACARAIRFPYPLTRCRRPRRISRVSTAADCLLPTALRASHRQQLPGRDVQIPHSMPLPSSPLASTTGSRARSSAPT